MPWPTARRMQVPRARPNRVRIIGGAWRSRLVSFPGVEGLRPSPDRVRETLFNWLGQDLSGLTCLDLYAGSGVLGFEALSRGATAVVMVERHPAVAKALRESAESLKATNAKIVNADAIEFARRSDARFDVIFIDPPYNLNAQLAAIASVDSLLRAGCRVYVEGDSGYAPPTGWNFEKRSRAGKVHFCILRRESDDPRSLSRDI